MSGHGSDGRASRVGERRPGGGAAALLCAAALLLAPSVSASQEPAHYLMVKLGDEAATREMAGGFLSRMSAWLEARVSRFEGREVRGSIANREDPALEILRERNPALAFVPAGFYLEHLAPDERGARPVAQIPRFGASVDRYYLVAPEDGATSLEDLRSRTVRTRFAYDEEYLRRVVFPDDFRPGSAFRLEPADNLADEMFFLLEGGDRGPEAVLLDEELKRFFEDDDMVWPEVRVVWRSEPLPRDLVVVLGSWSDAEAAGLRESLLSMSGTVEGREVLGLMDSSGFEPVREDLLERARRAYGWTP